MDTPLAGKTALVTGASGGLGAHFAKVLAGAGARVILAARREAELAEATAAITATGGHATGVRLDVVDKASIETVRPLMADLDILVNNAGLTRNGPAIDLREEDWDAVIQTNLKGTFLMAQAAAQSMRARGQGGVIINIASILGLRQAGGVLPYVVSKAGLIQMTKTLALELARYDIRVNALAPGYVDTPLNSGFWESDSGKAMVRRIPTRRLGQLNDLDGPLLLLASDAARHMTGSVVVVDGGHLVSTL